MAGWRSDPMTTRQGIAVRLIEQYLSVKFEGRTKGHASAFIGQYYDEAKRLRDTQSTQSMTNRQAVASLLQKKLLEEDPWDAK